MENIYKKRREKKAKKREKRQRKREGGFSSYRPLLT
jgi:hypothetical protein